jgi:hypothetical protein
MQMLLTNGLIFKLMEGPKCGIYIHLVRGGTLKVMGDKVKLLVQVGTSMGCITVTHEFLILEDDIEDMFMGVAWHKFGEVARIVDMVTIGISAPNPLQSGSDDAPEDPLLVESTLEVCPEPSKENWQFGNSAISTLISPS